MGHKTNGRFLVHYVGPRTRFWMQLSSFEVALERAVSGRRHGQFVGYDDCDVADAVLDGHAMSLARAEVRGEA